MRTLHAAAVFLLFFSLAIAPSALACSCSNNIPIQKSSPRYTSPGHAVFTARVVALIGRIDLFDGKRSSSQVLAVVRQRYWGLPWYWPKVVLLDGRYPCDIAMAENEDYLVAGRETRYGVVEVNLCSRTQPLQTAQLDLRTLDGTHCARPGGTIIGFVTGEWDSVKNAFKPSQVSSVTFSDLSGEMYRANVDGDGIYELRHLPPVPLFPVSRLDDHRFVSSQFGGYAFGSIAPIEEGVCQQWSFRIRDYVLTGRLLPGSGEALRVELLSTKPGSHPILAKSIEPDGRFYFGPMPPGDYLLSVVATIGDVNQQVFYPGVTDRGRAFQIVIGEKQPVRSYDFDANMLPVVPVPVVLDPAVGSEKFTWDFELVEQAGRVVATSRAQGTNAGLLFGMRGGAYRLRLYGYPRDPLKDDYCESQSVPLIATAGLSPVHITAQCAHADR